MTGPGKFLLQKANLLGQKLPKGLLRRIVDFPGVLKILEQSSRGETQEVLSPEGMRIVINPLFHANLVHSGSLDHYEPVIRKSIVRLTRPGMTAYDLGANVGIFSFLFASIVDSRGIVYAFEPEKINYTCLEQSIRINRCKNIVLDKRAIGNACGKEQFDRRGGAFSGRLIGNNEIYHKTRNIQTVETASLDYLVTNENFRLPDIIKIDVEGNEGLVLDGMTGILGRHAPIIICEIHTHLGESGVTILEKLAAAGYKVADAVSGMEITPDMAQGGGLQHAHIIATRK